MLLVLDEIEPEVEGNNEEGGEVLDVGGDVGLADSSSPESGMSKAVRCPRARLRMTAR